MTTQRSGRNFRRQLGIAAGMLCAVLVVLWAVVTSDSHHVQYRQWLESVERSDVKSLDALANFAVTGSSAVPFLLSELTNASQARLVYVRLQGSIAPHLADGTPEWTPNTDFDHQCAVLQALAAIGTNAQSSVPEVLGSLTNWLVSYHAGSPAHAYHPKVRSNALTTLGAIDPYLQQSGATLTNLGRAEFFGKGGMVRETFDRVLDQSRARWESTDTSYSVQRQ